MAHNFRFCRPFYSIQMTEWGNNQRLMRPRFNFHLTAAIWNTCINFYFQELLLRSTSMGSLISLIRRGLWTFWIWYLYRTWTVRWQLRYRILQRICFIRTSKIGIVMARLWPRTRSSRVPSLYSWSILFPVWNLVWKHLKSLIGCSGRQDVGTIRKLRKFIGILGRRLERSQYADGRVRHSFLVKVFRLDEQIL